MNLIKRNFRAGMAGVAIGLESAFPSRREEQKLIDGGAAVVQPVHGHAHSEKQAYPAPVITSLNREIRRALGVGSVAEALQSVHGDEVQLLDLVDGILARLAIRETLYGAPSDSLPLENIPK